MRVGDLVRFKVIQRYHRKGEFLTEKERIVGIIVEQYVQPDEALFVMMGDKNIGRGTEMMVVSADDVDVIYDR